MTVEFALALWIAAHGNAPPEASAREQTIAVLPPVFTGAVPPQVRTAVPGRIRDGLHSGGVALVGDAAVTAALGKRDACDAADCWNEVGRATSARLLVLTTVAFRDRVYQVKIAVIDVASGESVVDSAEVCEICGTAEVAEALENQAEAIAGRIAQLTRGVPLLAVSSAPIGAKVFVDGKPAGKTPFGGPLTPGRHIIRIEYPGYVPQEREVLAVEGGHEQIDLALRRADAGPDPGTRTTARGSRGMVVGGATLIGFGVVALVGGIPLVALDGRQYRRRCSGDDVDINDVCRFNYQTLAGGLALVVGGVIATATGAALVGVARKRGAKTSSRRARVRVTPTSGGIGFAF